MIPVGSYGKRPLVLPLFQAKYSTLVMLPRRTAPLLSEFAKDSHSFISITKNLGNLTRANKSDRIKK